MKTRLFLLVLLVGGLMASMGCDKKKTGRASPARSVRGGITAPINGTGNGSGTSNPLLNNYNGSTGSEMSFIRSNNSSSFEGAIRGLVSASMDPQELGYVSNYGDVVIIGFIDMDQAGNVNQANSRLRLEIWDDYARTGDASEIAIAFNNLSNVQWNGNYVTLVFQDGYGQIIVSGEVTPYDFNGEVRFENSRSFDGASAPAAGILGTFQVPACGFFRCQ